jgi:hypothetical protein
MAGVYGGMWPCLHASRLVGVTAGWSVLVNSKLSAQDGLRSSGQGKTVGIVLCPVLYSFCNCSIKTARE